MLFPTAPAFKTLAQSGSGSARNGYLNFGCNCAFESFSDVDFANSPDDGLPVSLIAENNCAADDLSRFIDEALVRELFEGSGRR